MSGGVDSSVSAALLMRQGYDVVGIFIRTWHPSFIKCNEEEERLDAMRVAARLGIPFLTFDLSETYKNEVAEYMISEYKKGRTPNPDVMCNKEVKFGAFLKKALSMGADYVATGHYAINKDLNLFKGVDSGKDQSYFLWTLTKRELGKILFPVGELNKKKVRQIARKYNLPVANKKDSQGICFLGEVDLKDFLKHYLKEKKGKVVNEKGENIGYHMGAVFSTLGERHGFTVTKKSPNDGPYYVLSKCVKDNILVVSQDKNLFKENKKNYLICLSNTNWIDKVPKKDKKYQAQIRYHGELYFCTIKLMQGNTAEVQFVEPVLVDKGQSCVIYDGNLMVGGGVVS